MDRTDFRDDALIEALAIPLERLRCRPRNPPAVELVAGRRRVDHEIRGLEADAAEHVVGEPVDRLGGRPVIHLEHLSAGRIPAQPAMPLGGVQEVRIPIQQPADRVGVGHVDGTAGQSVSSLPARPASG